MILNVFCMMLGSIFLEIAQIYIWYKLLEKKPNFRDPRLYITFISLTIISIANYFLVNKFIKIFLITIVFMAFFRFLFKEKLQKCILTPIFYQIFGLICESVYAIVFALIFGSNFEKFLSSPYGILITNLAIAGLNAFLSTRKISIRIYKSTLKLTNKLKRIELMPCCLIFIIILNIAIMAAYYRIDFKYLLVFNVLVILICSVIILYSLITKNKYNKVSDKYNIAIKSLNDYEDMMTKYRVANHENKNMLLTVRAMIINKDKNITKYIDSMIENKYLDDEKLLFNVSTIPSGGLRATIYSEILKIKENKINYTLNIDRNIKTVDLIELDTETIVDICKIIGVFIDNAIEEVVKNSRKEIRINLYIENNKFCIKISNNYSGKISVDKINNEGYTTKGKGHGYGLSLVRKIIKENMIFDHKTEIGKNIFSQVLVINYKKTR